ncbi:phosphotransferase [Clostridium tertium]|uniref:winged helix-turn-helix transcriptional regulator n=1 Tax=Clostridium tertium TaxID=1559 RepID=UPI00232CD515|nr:winged helix-turn-helix transcriptional regulator [Clostridium tertium]MDB1921745.1 phosphotransferase [Clostridium tertium]MDB1924948.1 phosphotransferase [Clostridium tertium]MDB1929389.1 phosphotransferase [Clostridium tertium]
MEYKFKVLGFLIENSTLSQRVLSKKVGVSLGKINNILKECLEEGLILKDYDSKVTKYTVTSKGEVVLRDTIKQLKDTKLMINEEMYYSVNEAVILAAGKREDFDVPTGTLKVGDIEVIQRSINILKENGINRIIIVTGYKGEYFKEILKNESNILLVNNDKYKWTGTMYSLALAKEYVSDDFILIESDLVYESQAIKKIIRNTNRDCLLITNESGSGDEAFVQLKDNYLFKMAKDIHQFNRTDGEMIGISKVSLKLYKMMLKEFENNINPYLNYEYMILDMARDYKVSCLKIDDLVWGEIDTINQYNKVKNNTYYRIKRKELEIEKDNIRNLVEKYFGIEYSKIEDVIPAGGMTNKNYKISIKGQEYILRIPGVGTENMITRSNEMINSKLAADMGLNVDIIKFDEKIGVKISKFIKGAETLTARTAKKEENILLVTDILRKLHNSEMEMKNRFDVFKEIDRYEEILKKYDIEFYNDYSDTRREVMMLDELLHKYSFRLVPSHNDTVPENFIKDEKGRLYLIDWEYSGLNDEMWDLAAYSLECGFSEDDDELLLRIYFKGKIEKNNKIKILINKILQDFLWSIWTLIKEAEGDNFGTYGIDRYNRAKRNINILYSII